MEENKKGKGVKVFLVIFIILFLAAAGALGYGYTKYKDLNTKYENVNKDTNKVRGELDATKDKLSSSDKNYIEISDVNYSNFGSYNLYSISSNTAVIGFKGEVYYFDHGGEYSNCVTNLIYDKGDYIKFRNGKSICFDWDSGDGDSAYAYVYKTDIKEQDLYKSISAFNPGNTGYNYVVFFILKDGSVKIKGDPDLNTNEISNYKIKDIKKFYCSSGGKDTCKGPLKLDVVLQDGSEKTIELE